MGVLRCQGCGLVVPPESRHPERCPNAGDGGDHVVGRELELGLSFPEGSPDEPFVHYRELTYAYALASSHHLCDDAFVTMVRDLDRAVARVDGHGFRATPFERSEGLSRALSLSAPGGVWVKDETGNVSGSHKGRHLMGLALLRAVRLRLGQIDDGQRLAIASCGNAALAAAVLAAASGAPLDVFIPADAHARVVAKLEALGASVHVCPRAAGVPNVPGDPCYHAFREAVAAGAAPFCCQGNENGLAIEGGETLAWEVISSLTHPGAQLDRAFVQVGGGALASAWVEGFRDARSLGVQVRVPRLHAVQTRGAFPLRRAWERVVRRIAERLGLDPRAADAVLAERIQEARDSEAVLGVLDDAARHRSEFMWPWETPPESIAHGILDDETYDWFRVVKGMIDSGGFPIVVDEERLRQANAVGRESTGIDVDPTGTAGLAGLLELSANGSLGKHESALVLFTGVVR